jgi:hypothetical protein
VVFKVTDHFKGKEPVVTEIYAKLIATCDKFGRVTQSAKKTSIHLDAKAGFAGVYVRRNYILLHVPLGRKLQSPRVAEVEQLSANRYKHTFKLTSPGDIDQELTGWLKEAYTLRS